MLWTPNFYVRIKQRRQKGSCLSLLPTTWWCLYPRCSQCAELRPKISALQAYPLKTTANMLLSIPSPGGTPRSVLTVTWNPYNSIFRACYHVITYISSCSACKSLLHLLKSFPSTPQFKVDVVSQMTHGRLTSDSGSYSYSDGLLYPKSKTWEVPFYGSWGDICY